MRVRVIVYARKMLVFTSHIYKHGEVAVIFVCSTAWETQPLLSPRAKCDDELYTERFWAISFSLVCCAFYHIHISCDFHTISI